MISVQWIDYWLVCTADGPLVLFSYLATAMRRQNTVGPIEVVESRPSADATSE